MHGCCSEADLLTMANGTSAARAAEAAAGGRRLLWSIRNVFDLDLGDKAATMAAGALGTGLGFASGMLANELGTAITVAGVAAFATASLPVMIVGVGGAIALGMVASSLAQEAMDKGAEMLYDQFESDAVVEAAFKQGQQVSLPGGNALGKLQCLLRAVVATCGACCHCLAQWEWQAAAHTRLLGSSSGCICSVVAGGWCYSRPLPDD